MRFVCGLVFCCFALGCGGDSKEVNSPKMEGGKTPPGMAPAAPGTGKGSTSPSST